MSIEARLSELGHALPAPAAPVAAYVPAVEAGGLLYLSGQLPFRDGAVVTGRCGESADLETAREAAERCGLMILAQAKAALGWDSVSKKSPDLMCPSRCSLNVVTVVTSMSAVTVEAVGSSAVTMVPDTAPKRPRTLLTAMCRTVNETLECVASIVQVPAW